MKNLPLIITNNNNITNYKLNKLLPLFGLPIKNKLQKDKFLNKNNLEFLNKTKNNSTSTLTKIIKFNIKNIYNYNKELITLFTNKKNNKYNNIDLILNSKNISNYSSNFRVNQNINRTLNLINSPLLNKPSNPLFTLRKDKNLSNYISYLNFTQIIFIRNINLHIKDVELRNKIINNIINNLNENKNLSNSNSSTSKTNNNLSKLNIFKIDFNLLELFVTSLKIINHLNFKILLLKNKIKLLKYLNILVLNSKQNKVPSEYNDNLIINKLNIKPSITTGSVGEAVGEKDKFIERNNLIKINQTKNNIENITEFTKKNNYITNNPLNLVYNKNLEPVLNQYLKTISFYNLKRKGIIFSYSNIIAFNFIKQNNKLKKNLYKLLYSFFYSMNSIISKPIFIITSDKIKIQLFYYLLLPFKNKVRYRINSKNYKVLNRFKRYKKIFNVNRRKIFNKLSFYSLIDLYPNKFKLFCEYLNRLFKKHIELDLIRLHYPYNDSNILVNVLALMIKKIKLRIIYKKLFKFAIIKNPNKISNLNKNNNLPSFLSGINIKIGGRLMTHKLVPRKTVQIKRRGILAKGKVNFLDVARLTQKNKRGAFSITISSGQNLT